MEQTGATPAKVEAGLAGQPEPKTVTAYVGQGAPRFYLAMAPELPDPSFAKIVVLTQNEKAREALKFRLRQALADGLAPEARARVAQLVFGPYSPFPVAFRVMGPDADTLRDIAAQARAVMQASALMRTVNSDWGERVPALRFALDQDRLQSIGLTSTAVWKELQPIIVKLPAGYRIEQGGSIEESGKANRAMAPLFPIMIALTLITIIFQVRSISAMTMVFATAPLGLIGVIPTLLLFKQPFGINALVGLIALSGILMRNTLILIGQIRNNEKDGLAPVDAVVEATVQRSRPVILTALAAMLAFIPLTQSVFWGTLAYTLIGGTFGGTGLPLVFLPGLYALWFKIKPVAKDRQRGSGTRTAPVAGGLEGSWAGALA